MTDIMQNVTGWQRRLMVQCGFLLHCGN